MHFVVCFPHFIIFTYDFRFTLFISTLLHLISLHLFHHRLSSTPSLPIHLSLSPSSKPTLPSPIPIHSFVSLHIHIHQITTHETTFLSQHPLASAPTSHAAPAQTTANKDSPYFQLSLRCGGLGAYCLVTSHLYGCTRIALHSTFMRFLLRILFGVLTTRY